MQLVTSLTGSESIEIVQDGVSKRCTIEQIAAAQPDSKGIYPDVPLNRVTLKRFVAQASTTVVLCDNVGMVDALAATAYPVLIDRNSQIQAYLNGNDITKTADGLPATLDDWTLQAMTRMGGFYYKYYYVASTNEKVYHFSTKPVRGYKYKRRRFLNIFGGCIENHDGKDMLLSNANKFTTQSRNITQYHTAAKNLGEHFREIATQDREVYRMYFWLMEKTFDSQSVIRGICDVNSTQWSKLNRSADGGQSSYGQFYKTGVTNTVKGHKGVGATITLNNGEADIQVAPYKWLWREGMLSGPYWIWETGYLKKAGKWYRAKDINSNVNFDPTNTDYWEYLCDECATAGYILEDFEDTLIVTQSGGSTSTGHADNYWRADDATGNNVYIPAGVGRANGGSNLGVSVLSSSNVVSDSYPFYGGALASDDPTDTIADGTVVA